MRKSYQYEDKIRRNFGCESLEKESIIETEQQLKKRKPAVSSTENVLLSSSSPSPFSRGLRREAVLFYNARPLSQSVESPVLVFSVLHSFTIRILAGERLLENRRL